MTTPRETTREEFGALMAALDLGTRGRAPSAVPVRPGEPSQMDQWYRQMRDLHPGAIKAAVDRFLCEGGDRDDWPSIKILRKYASEHVNGLPMTADAAWEAVRACLKRWSIYRTREENEAIVNSLPEPARRVASSLGWRAMSEATDLNSYLRSFCIEYTAASERYARQLALPPGVRPRIQGPKPLALDGERPPRLRIGDGRSPLPHREPADAEPVPEPARLTYTPPPPEEHDRRVAEQAAKLAEWAASKGGEP